MYLFIDTLSDPTFIALFDASRHIVAEFSWSGKMQEFDTLIETIDRLLRENNQSYKELQGIVVVVGPGGFTGTRVTTLVANTLAHSFQTPLFPLTAGELFALQDAPLPWMTPLTKKETLIWNTKNLNSFTITPLEVLTGEYSSLVMIDLPNTKYKLTKVDNYKKIIKNIALSEPLSRVKPLYARDPNITVTNTPHVH